MVSDDSDSYLLSYEVAEQWRVKYAGDMFPTRASLAWFLRMNRHDLVECGALILRAGRSGNMVHRSRMVEAVQRIRRTDSLARLTRDGDAN